MGQKAVFLDRDDTLIQDPGYIRDPDQVKLMAGAPHALWQLQKMGYLVIVVTNQSGIARGLITPEQLEEVHRRMNDLLASEGAYLDAIYHCPYHPDGTVAPYNCDSDLRKPSPGMLLLAAKEKDIDLAESWMIGDSYRDIEAGRSAGCHTILVDVPGKPRVKQADEPEPERKAVNLREAVNIIRMFEFHQKVQKVRTAVYEKREGEAMIESPSEKEQGPAGPQNLMQPKKEDRTDRVAQTGGTTSDADACSAAARVPAPEKEKKVTRPAKEAAASVDRQTDVGPPSRPSDVPTFEKEETLKKPAPGADISPVNKAVSDANTPSAAAHMPALDTAKTLLNTSGETEPVTPKARTFKKTAEPANETVDETGDRTTQLLEDILQQLKNSGREGLYQEFSVFKLIAMLLQMLAVFCLVASVGYWLSAGGGHERVYLMLGYSVALQLLVIALMMMHQD